MNPGSSEDDPKGARSQRRSWMRVSGREFPTTAVLLIAVAAFSVWQVTQPRAVKPRPNRRELCFQNFQMIGRAMAQYHQRYKSFPPAYIADAQGRPRHSWRVLLLPFLGENKLYNAYHWDEPWDSPHNAKLMIDIPFVYRCSLDSQSSINQANIALVTGPGTLFDGSHVFRREDITDGLDRTLLAVEVADSGYPWTAPRDLPLESLSQAVNADPHAISSRHHWAHGLLVSGRIAPLSPSMSPELLRALCTPRGGEKIDADAF